MGETRYNLDDSQIIRFGYDDFRYGCLCTFPFNYKKEKLGLGDVESMALLGAAVALYRNSRSSLIKEDWMGDEYVLPDCLPLWVREEIRRNLGDYPEKFDSGEYDMDNVSSEVSDEEFKNMRIKRFEDIKKWCDEEIEYIKTEEIFEEFEEDYYEE